MKLKTVPLSDLVPYWRNPRRIPEEAVTALVESIDRYGYRQPISVDRDNVIIVGHTRFAALKRLGYTEAEVNVVDDLSPQQIKQLRIIDNKSGEFTFWDFTALSEEVGELDNDLMIRFFPEITQREVDEVLQVDEKTKEEAASDSSEWDDLDLGNAVEFVCPSCFHLWQQEVSRQDVFAGQVPMLEEKK